MTEAEHELELLSTCWKLLLMQRSCGQRVQRAETPSDHQWSGWVLIGEVNGDDWVLRLSTGEVGGWKWAETNEQ